MKSVKKTNKKVKIVFSLSLIYSLIMVNIAYWGESGIRAANKREEDLKRLEKGIITITKENNRLVKEIDSLSNDPFTIERIAREQLGMVKEGEIVIEFVDP